MCDITFKRIFHPVGHGAFFTEQFIDPISNIVLYNVVYDCGSVSPQMKERIYHISDDMFYKNRCIDALFLSHFDDDHVNAIKYLVDRHYLYGTKLFVPLLKEESIVGVFPYYSNYHYISNLNGNNRIKVIKVDFDSEKEDGAEQPPILIEELKDNYIGSGTKLSSNHVDCLWYYIPFNIVNDNEVFETLMKKLDDADLDYSKLTDKEDVSNNLKKIRKVYQTIGKKPANGTKINFNSLQLLSYPAKTDTCKEYSRHSTNQYYFEDYYRWNKGYVKYKFHHEGLYPGSCLYTGDTSANIEDVWKKIILIIDKYLKRKLVLFQIPHHGSINSNDFKSLADKKIYATFANYGDFKGKCIFNPILAYQFEMIQKPLIHVTDDWKSSFEEQWILSK